MSDTQESLLRSRELFYVDGLKLESTPLFCTDERESDQDDYLHAAGGGLNTVYNLRIVAETVKPGAETMTFEDDTKRVIPLIKELAQARPGVHSQEDVEGGAEIKSEADADVDCGYAKLRQTISQSISDNRNQIIADAKELRPELFESDEDNDYAFKVADAHGRMARNDAYFNDGRHVVTAAADAGAETMVVRGGHTGKDAILNLRADSSLSSNMASRAGLPTYEHDGWATAEIAARLQDKIPHDPKQLAIAELIDVIGTWRALGVENIAVRRPQAA